MRLNNIAGFKDIDSYILDKIGRFSKEEKTFETLFKYMFSESENVMAEISDGFRIKKITYGQCKERIFSLASKLKGELSHLKEGDKVGVYLGNSVFWIETFWAILMLGFNPLLLNSRMNDAELEKILSFYSVNAVISDGKIFGVKTLLDKDIEKKDEGDKNFSKWGTEVIFMSSGTTENVKLCSYTAENFFYQIGDSISIIKNCPQMKKHVDGQLKILALLPFYHVFGFIAVYTWFAFFSRTLVFLKDLNPQTLLSTIRKHKVTHIFAVPLIWETVYRSAIKTIKERGQKTLDKFQKALKFVNKHEKLGNFIAKSAFKEVRENLFGESICFLISGGSAVSKEVLEFFNGIGYHMANGYGMTEIGITSVDVSMKRKERNEGRVGSPFKYTQYKISPNGELLVKGKTMASKIQCGNAQSLTDFEEWFNTFDLAVKDKKGYYIQGRKDDLIVCDNGENLNPEIVERALNIKNAEEKLLLSGEKGKPTLVVRAKSWVNQEGYDKLVKEIEIALDNAKLLGEVKEIFITRDKLLGDGEFKASRKKVLKRILSGEIRKIDCAKELKSAESQLEKQIANIVRLILEIDGEISITADFFTDLGGSSLDYFTLLSKIADEYGVSAEVLRSYSESTVQGLANLINQI